MDFYKAAGIFFGYPDCCSTWFVKRNEGEVPFKLTPIQVKIDTGYGFLPCPECAKKVYKEKSPIEGLIKNRICSTPYPQEDLKQLKKYIRELKSSNQLT